MLSSFAVIIPAYNEQETIREVVRIVVLSPRVGEVVVVNDGSTDDTLEIIQNLQKDSFFHRKLKIVNLSENQGKSAAIFYGLGFVRAEFVLLLDADLIGLNFNHINDLIRPVSKGKADMTIGIFKGGRFFSDLAHKIAPGLSGQRAIRKSCLRQVNWEKVERFGLETYLNRLTTIYGWRMEKVVLLGVTHAMKQEKRGFFLGLKQRSEMYLDILKEYIKNYISK